MTPFETDNGAREHLQQRALFMWANCAALYGVAYADRPEAYDFRTRDALQYELGSPYTIPALKRLFAIHNQGHGDIVRGNRAKAEGVKAGVPDLMLPQPIDGLAGLFIELKRSSKKDTQGNQNDWIDYLNQVGYKCVVAVGWRGARIELVNYLWPILPHGVSIS